MDRLIVSNLLEWGLQPERAGLPECALPPPGQAFPPDDMSLSWSGDRKLVITRHPQDDQHLQDLRAILGQPELHCVTVPGALGGHSLCAELARDDRTLSQVIELLADGAANGPVTVEGYAATPEYADLIGRIRDRAKRPVADQLTPARHLHLTRDLDSKLDSRPYFEAAARQCPALRLTRAAALRPGGDLAGQVEQAARELGPVIVKTEFGAGGNSMAVIRPGDDARAALDRALPPGYRGGLLVEEFLGAGREVLSVACNGLILTDGSFCSLGMGVQLLKSGKLYLGTQIGRGAVPAELLAGLRDGCEAVGAAAAAAGYRGPLGIDFLCRRSDGAIFPLEVNPRRTLGAALADICISLFGLGYEKTVSAVIRQNVLVHRSIGTYPKVREALLRKGWLGRDRPGLVVVPFIASSLAVNSSIGLAVLGADGTSAAEALGEIGRYLGRRHWR